MSYINNLHPEYHRELYDVIARIVSKALPLWNRVLSSALWYYQVPERVSDWSNSDAGYPKGWEEDRPEQGEEEDDDDFEQRSETFKEEREVIHPEPGEFKSPADRLKAHYSHAVKLNDVDPFVDLRRRVLSQQTNQDGLTTPHPVQKNLQVIVKLANIHLTPEKPEYKGGTWHVEGQANESM